MKTVSNNSLNFLFIHSFIHAVHMLTLKRKLVAVPCLWMSEFVSFTIRGVCLLRSISVSLDFACSNSFVLGADNWDLNDLTINGTYQYCHWPISIKSILFALSSMNFNKIMESKTRHLSRISVQKGDAFIWETIER